MAIGLASPVQLTGTPATNVPQHFNALDGCRIIAIWIVVLVHCNGLLGFPVDIARISLVDPVCYFFMLSGFVLTHNYGSLTYSDARMFGRYIGARYARFWPCYIAATALWFLVHPESCNKSYLTGQIFWSNVLLIQSWFPDPKYYFVMNAPAWTLSVEVFLCFAFPALLLLSNHRWRFVAGSIVFSCIAHALAFRFHPENVTWCCAVFPIVRLLDFSMGIAIYTELKEFKFRLRSSTVYLFELLFVAIWIARALRIPEACSAAVTAALHLSPFAAIVFDDHLMKVATYVPLLIALAAGNGIFARLFSFKALVALSVISCSLYMIHSPLIEFFAHLSGYTKAFHPFLISGVLVFIGIGGYAMYLLVEEPGRKLIKNVVDFVLGFKTKPFNFAATFSPLLLSSVLLFATLGTLYAVLRAPIAQAAQPVWLSQAGAQIISADSLEYPKDVTFGKVVTLVAIEKRSTPDKVILKSLWRTTKNSVPCQLHVHFLDSKGQIVDQCIHGLLPTVENPNLLWTDELEIKKANFAYIKEIGMAVIVNEETVTADKGRGDWGMHRLLLDVKDF